MSTDEIGRTSNGCTVARRVPRRDAGWRPSYNIAAIDFGTTNCSLAYSIARKPPSLLQLDDALCRVPTAVLFDQYGSVTHVGYEARRVYSNYDDEELLEHAYFEQFKMNLQNEELVNRKMKVTAQNGKKYYLVEVIAHTLKFLKDRFIKKLNKAGYKLNATDFDWVITVPAIWRSKGKQMMREAGYKAGLCSQCSCIPLQPASSLPQPPDEQHPEKLSLALEPEAAAIFCQNMTREQLAEHCQDKPPFKASCYLVIDIGGGTVDISAMQRVMKDSEECVRVLHRPTGNDYGGARVNKKFQDFLETLVDDRGLQHLLCTVDEHENARNQAVLNELLNETFERQKKLFGNLDSTKRLHVEFPCDFWSTYKGRLERGVKARKSPEIELKRQKLLFSQEMMAKFVEPIKDGILDSIAHTLKEVKERVETFYLVGGFGGCKYLFGAIRERFGRKYRCIVPAEPAHAVVYGAVLNRLKSSLVESRIVDATYGIGTNLPFDPELHDPEYRWKDDDGEYKCRNMFSTIVERGDPARSGEVFRATYCPVEHDQTSMQIEFYCSQEKDVWYVTGRRGRGSYSSESVEVHKIGHIQIDMPDLTGDKSREVDVTFDFSHSEIQVKAFDRTTSNEITTILDFLSY